jgi:aspartokinase
MEIIAVYREKKIKTYGFHTQTGLQLASVTLPVHQVAEWGNRIDKKSGSRNFVMALVQMSGEGALRLYFLFDPDEAEAEAFEANLDLASLAVSDLKVEAPVELVYFHGPHYGDRYGIAHATFSALASQGMSVLAAGCTGSSLYIVVPEKTAQTVTRCLSETFEVPG